MTWREVAESLAASMRLEYAAPALSEEAIEALSASLEDAAENLTIARSMDLRPTPGMIDAELERLLKATRQIAKFADLPLPRERGGAVDFLRSIGRSRSFDVERWLNEAHVVSDLIAEAPAPTVFQFEWTTSTRNEFLGRVFPDMFKMFYPGVTFGQNDASSKVGPGVWFVQFVGKELGMSASREAIKDAVKRAVKRAGPG
jgi:hypothetical protein